MEQGRSDRNGLPPRPKTEHKRSWSGGVNFQGVENMLQSFSPPLFTRKKATTIQEEMEEFHNQNQKFLKFVQKTSSKQPSLSSSGGSHNRESPRRQISLESIGDDDWEDASSYDSSTSNDDKRQVEVRDMHLLNDQSSVGDDSEYTAETSPRQRTRRADMERKLDSQRIQREANRKNAMERKLSSVLNRHIVSRKEKEEFVKEYVKELEREREALLHQWRAEFEAEEGQEFPHHDPTANRGFSISTLLLKVQSSIYEVFASCEMIICNMPLTVAALALSWATVGVVWYKFVAESLVSRGLCKTVHFHSPTNSYPHEFPGSFHCEEPAYHYALYFHFACSIVAAILAMSFLAKILMAWRVVSEDLTNPVTATPVGLICITLEILCAAAGEAGSIVIYVVAGFHAIFAFWYLYVAVYKFRLLPDPSWFPGTTGMAYAAVKCWLYSNMAGKIFLGLCLSFFFCTYFISIIRVALNKKIAAPVCWIQLSAPSIAMYACTIMSQPVSELAEARLVHSQAANHKYLTQMHGYYLPFQHVMFALSLLGMASALHALYTRWDTFRLKKFSPAHLGFCFPTLSHTNAIQAYRAGVNSFSSLPRNHPYHVALFAYWTLCLVVGTVLLLIFTYKFLVRLPEWTLKISTVGEIAPPAPAETIMSEMLHDAREIIDQPFVSPAVLQANETGTLVRLRRGTEDFRVHGPYVRTRHVTALGFDPTLSDSELQDERARLLDWVARNAPRTRNRTWSIPMMLKLKDEEGRNIYGTFEDEYPATSHRRSQTMNDASAFI